MHADKKERPIMNIHRTSIFVVGLLGLLLVACGDGAEKPTDGQTREEGPLKGAPATEVVVKGQPDILEVPVHGMSCQTNCAPKVKTVLAAVPGIKQVQVIAADEKAYCALEDPKADEEERARLVTALRQALAEADQGFSIPE